MLDLMGTTILLDLMGGVTLLLWGLHMVHSGILRAFGPDLRRFLSHALGNRFAAFAAGLGLTTLLQSSTATALMTASFTAEGMVALVPALAIMLGANVGTTLIVQVLSFSLAPRCCLCSASWPSAPARAHASRTSAASPSGWA